VLDIVAQRLEQYPPDAPWTADEIPLSVPEVWKLLSERLEPTATQEEGEVDGPTRATSRVFGEILRWALVASDPSPANKMVAEFLGRDETLRRVKTAAEVASQTAEDPLWSPGGFRWLEEAEMRVLLG